MKLKINDHSNAFKRLQYKHNKDTTDLWKIFKYFCNFIVSGSISMRKVFYI